MKLVSTALNGFCFLLNFSGHLGLQELLLNYRNKLVYFWQKSIVPLEFQLEHSF